MELLGILILYEAAILVNAADSCETSRRTVVRVNKCPGNKTEWREAAYRKNCSSLAGLCSEPDKFVYHCVLNPFVNETLEVCAYGRRILLGRCTSYSILGNLIQESTKECKMFPRPCPLTYSSTEAYKYQGCYNLVQRPATSQTTEEIPSTTSSLDSSTSHNITERPGSENSAACCDIVVGVISMILSLSIFVAFLLVYLWRKRQKKLRVDLNEEDNQNELGINFIMSSGPVVEASSKENDALLYPSGELLKIDIKNIEVHQEEETQVAKLCEIQPKKNLKPLLEQLDDVVKKLIVTKSVEDPEDESHLPGKLKNLYKSDTQFSDEKIPLIQECIQEILELNCYFETRKRRLGRVKLI